MIRKKFTVKARYVARYRSWLFGPWKGSGGFQGISLLAFGGPGSRLFGPSKLEVHAASSLYKQYHINHHGVSATAILVQALAVYRRGPEIGWLRALGRPSLIGLPEGPQHDSTAFLQDLLPVIFTYYCARRLDFVLLMSLSFAVLTYEYSTPSTFSATQSHVPVMASLLFPVSRWCIRVGLGSS